MIKIEMELTSTERNVTDVFQKMTEILRNLENQGFNVKEIEFEVEEEEEGEEGEDVEEEEVV
jgi:hypothetical protein